jgi:hypothetical protein
MPDRYFMFSGSKADAEFIANARHDIPALLDENALLREDASARQTITLALPDGTELVAKCSAEPSYPSISISLRVPGREDKLLCLAENNSDEPEGKELCIYAYSSGQDEPVYNACFGDYMSLRGALCDRCIRAIQSRGEKVYVGNRVRDKEVNICVWCKEPDDELFEASFDNADE